MSTSLVIVESPAKAKKIAEYLGDDYVVESSVGHIRDLPRNADDVPAAYKGEAWARLGVDVENDFKPLYVVTGRAKDQVKRLKSLLKDADELLLATDEDREGEAIAWHLIEVLSPTVPIRRMVFHEITPKAIREAVEQPRELDRRLVDAQEARRILDRLYGYEVSPVLWKKVMPRLSAGRVQSVAVRLVVEREQERIAFRRATYWDLQGTFTSGAADPFDAALVRVDDAKVATGRDFDDTGTVADGVVVLDEARATGLRDGLTGQDLTVSARESRPYRRRPAAPFMTSTLQQEAGRKLGFSSSRTMRAAQRLYESGYITYMRTDSTTLSADALSAARDLIRGRYGAELVPDEPRTYHRKVKNAQEAHEAVRPAGEAFRLPDDVRSEVGADEGRVYELIFQRTVASQMIDATGETVTIRLGGRSTDGDQVEFSTAGTVIRQPGFRLVYVEESDDGNADRERVLPPLEEGDTVTARELEAKSHETSPPSRFTEASLVKRLEEIGVGRPSTYASIMETIQDRGYVWKKGSALVPAFTAFATVRLLTQHFPDLVDYAFTARMEEELDDIAGGRAESIPWLDRFYHGDVKVRASGGTGHDALGLKELVSDISDIDARAINTIPLGVDGDGVAVAARVGRYGPYVARGDDTAGIPDDVPPDELTLEKAIELLSAPSEERVLGIDPETGLEVIARPGRFGPYIQLGQIEDGSKEKPKTASLFSDMDLTTVTFEDALKLLSLPRVVGTDVESGEEILALNGRYGPYIKKGTDSRSLETEAQLFTVDLDEAQRIFAQPKRRRGQAPAKPPLAELGPDPVSDQPMVVKEGRFGPYVTDGEVNASLRKGDEPTTLTADRASELLEMRRQKLKDEGKWPPKGKKKAAKKQAKAKKRASAKKAGAKKAGAKKRAAKKRAAKKQAAKQVAPAPAADGES
ncbi:MAG: type I DNA topoisomerase [Actinomycetota bacterium]